jgi:hypothetical protein
VRNRNAELVLGLAGGDLFMGARIHVRVHAHGDRRGLAHGGRDLRQDLKLRLAFDVELADAALQRHAHLLGGLADAGKHDPLPRHTGGLRAQVFAARDHVHPGAQPGQMRQDRLVGIRLHREADKVVQTANASSNRRKWRVSVAQE